MKSMKFKAINNKSDDCISLFNSALKDAIMLIVGVLNAFLYIGKSIPHIDFMRPKAIGFLLS